MSMRDCLESYSETNYDSEHTYSESYEPVGNYRINPYREETPEEIEAYRKNMARIKRMDRITAFVMLLGIPSLCLLGGYLYDGTLATGAGLILNYICFLGVIMVFGVGAMLDS